VDASTFDQGRAFLGGALYVRQASGSTSLAVTASSFARNVATAPGLGGGAMAVLGGHVQVDASTFAANTSSAAGGGAVSLSSGSMAMLDSTFDGDIAVASGDILSVGAGRPRKRALPYDLSIGWSTLVAGARPAIGVDKRRIKGDRTTITGSMVLSQAPAGACTGAPPTSGGGNIGDDSCGLTAVTDRPATQPSPTLVPGASAMPGVQPSSAPGTDAWAWLVGPLADNGGPTLTRLPVEGSIAVDATAGVAGCPAVDQRGVPRPQGPACDAGAVEVGPTP